TKDSEPKNAVPTPPATMPPYVYDEPYGTRRDTAANACDDKTYGKPQIHGDVSMGVAAGHVSGSYQAAGINATKALGTCDDPKGHVGLSISVEQDNLNHRHTGRPWPQDHPSSSRSPNP